MYQIIMVQQIHTSYPDSFPLLRTASNHTNVDTSHNTLTFTLIAATT